MLMALLSGYGGGDVRWPALMGEFIDNGAVLHEQLMLFHDRAQSFEGYVYAVFPECYQQFVQGIDFKDSHFFG